MPFERSLRVLYRLSLSVIIPLFLLSSAPADSLAQISDEMVLREATFFIDIYGMYSDTITVYGLSDFHWSERYFNGLTDVIDTEILEMSLHGESEGFGCFSILQKNGLPNPGQVEFPGPGGDFPAESFFDIYFDLYAPMVFPDTLHTNSPMRLVSIIDEMPPFFNEHELLPAGTVFIYDVGETLVGEITYWSEVMLPYYPPSALVTAETSYGSDIAIAYDDTIMFSADVAGFIEPDIGMSGCELFEPFVATFGIRMSGTADPFDPFYVDLEGLGLEYGTVVPMQDGDGWAGYLDIASYPPEGGRYDIEVIFDVGYFELRDTVTLFIDPTPPVPQFIGFSVDSVGFFEVDSIHSVVFQVPADPAANANLAVRPLAAHWERDIEVVKQEELSRFPSVAAVCCGPASAASCLKFWAKNGYPALEHTGGDMRKPVRSAKKMGWELRSIMKPKASKDGAKTDGIAEGVNKYLERRGLKDWKVENKEVKNMTDVAAMMREFEADSEDVIMFVSDVITVGTERRRVGHAVTMGSRHSTTARDTVNGKAVQTVTQEVDFMDPQDGTSHKNNKYEVKPDSTGVPRTIHYNHTENLGNARISGYLKVSPPAAGGSPPGAPPSTESSGWRGRYNVPQEKTDVTYGSWTIVDSGPATGNSLPDTFHWDTTGFPGGLYLLELSATDVYGNVGTAIRFAGIPEYTVDSDIPGPLPAATWIRSSFPNPFNPATTIEYSVSRKTQVTMSVHDVSGRLVAVLVDRETKDPGIYRTRWNGFNSRGNRAASGLYFCVLRSEEGLHSRKLIMLR